MSKKILALDSQFLGRFQHCPMDYKYSAIVQIEPTWKRAALNFGSAWTRIMEVYYRMRMLYRRDWVERGIYNDKVQRFMKRIKRICEEGFGDAFLDENERSLLWSRVVLYEKTYRNESWIPVAMESGFSFLLYEDDEYQFIYEGRPDLVVMMPDPLNPSRWVRVVVDHKTRGRNEDLADYNNQVNGYLCAADTRYFIYNYCGKQTTGGTEKYFQRQIVSRSPQALAAWKQSTIEWFFRIAKTIESGKFLKSMQCEGKYGICEFYKLCSADDEIGFNGALQSNYRKKEQEWKAW
jgi:hypothetical protein